MEVQGKLLSKDREMALLKQEYEDKLKKHQTELTNRQEKIKKQQKSFDEMM